MPFNVPTLEQAVQRARARLRAEMPGTDAAIFPNTEYVEAKVRGGDAWELYQFLAWISRQRFATTADGDMLDAHAGQYGLTRNAATQAHGKVAIHGTPGHFVATGALVERSDGVAFATLDDLVLSSSGSGVVAVQAVATGPGSNTVGGAELEPDVGGSDITRIVVEPDGIGGGADIEDDESFRARLLLRLRYPPHGGAAHDYVFWALSISGISRVWVDPLAYGPGTVGVWVMAEGNGTAHGLPSPTNVQDVQDYIDSVKPVTARAIVQAPIPAVIDVRVQGVSGVTPALDQAVRTELADVFRRQVQVSMPGAPFALRANLLWQAVARATRDSAHTIGLPAGDLAMPPGYIPVLGTVCYVE